MINALDFELYLENNKKEKCDLIATDFDLYVNNLNSKTSLDYDEFESFDKVISYLKDAFSGEDIALTGACASSHNKDRFEDFILKQKKGLKLHFINKNIDKHLYCFVDLVDISSSDINKYDEYEMSILFKRRTNWIKEVLYSFDKDSEEYPVFWKYGNKRPVVYSKQKNVYSAVTLALNIEGHDAAPFLITFANGAQNIKWQLRNSDGNITDSSGWEYSGELDVPVYERFYIDSYNSMIYSEESDYSYLRDKQKMNFFNIPLGKCTLFIEGVTDKVGVIVYEQYNKI